MGLSKNVATLGVLTVGVTVRPGVYSRCSHPWSGRFGDPYSTKGPSSSVFDGQSRTKRLPGDLSRNPLVTLGLRSLSLWRGVHFDSQRLRRSCAEILTRGSFIERLEILAPETSYRDLVQRAFIEILSRDLAKRSLTEILPTELL